MHIKRPLILLSFLLLPFIGFAQNWHCFFELDYYTTEPYAHLVILPPASWVGKKGSINLEGASYPNINQTFELKKKHRIAINLRDVIDLSTVRVQLKVGNQSLEESAVIRKLAPKRNAVKINRLSNSLMIDGLPFFPAGFYCYSPVQHTLAEEEVVRGFNMMSPYQKITGPTLSERKAYLDRCAQLGMKVHYNLLSVAGGGGVGQSRSDYNGTTRLALLRNEILEIKDHPALLAWYISDEPTGEGVKASELKATYDLIKQLDPYHPISIVFMNPKRAKEYKEVMDIVMADPYPIPNRSPLEVGSIIQKLADEFKYEKPVWLVPQAFGGNEHWAREPSPQEIQLMTWLGTLNGASGIQYFIRHGLSSFPKSSLTWDAASKTIKEIIDLSPFLLQADQASKMDQKEKQLLVRWYMKDNYRAIVVINQEKEPQSFQVKLPPQNQTEAQVLFEDRRLSIENNSIKDYIEAYGRRIYLIEGENPISNRPMYSQNMLVDPSFENSLVPGTPAACYFKLGGDRGAYASLDTRMAMHGRQSLRMVTPSRDQGLNISLFPVKLEKEESYALTFWAKADHNRSEISFRIGNGAEKSFPLSAYWKEYQWIFKSSGKEATRGNRSSISFSLKSQGTAWIDLLQLSPDPRIEFKDDPFASKTLVTIESAAKEPGLKIFYNLDGRPATSRDRLYKGPLSLTQSSRIHAAAQSRARTWNNNRALTVNIHKAKSVRYDNKCNANYTADGALSLIDGVRGSARFGDGKWQGWNSGHIKLTIDYGKSIRAGHLHANFLMNQGNWIYPPEKIQVFGSKNGKDFQKIGEKSFRIPTYKSTTKIENVSMPLDGNTYRYIHLVATRLTSLPEDHPSSGGNPFIFLDEVMVER